MGNIKLFGMPLKEFSDTLMEAARLEKLRLVLAILMLKERHYDMDIRDHVVEQCKRFNDPLLRDQWDVAQAAQKITAGSTANTQWDLVQCTLLKANRVTLEWQRRCVELQRLMDRRELMRDVDAFMAKYHGRPPITQQTRESVIVTMEKTVPLRILSLVRDLKLSSFEDCKISDQSMVSLLCYVSGQLSHLSPNVIDVQRGQIILDLLKTIIDVCQPSFEVNVYLCWWDLFTSIMKQNDRVFESMISIVADEKQWTKLTDVLRLLEIMQACWNTILQLPQRAVLLLAVHLILQRLTVQLEKFQHSVDAMSVWSAEAVLQSLNLLGALKPRIQATGKQSESEEFTVQIIQQQIVDLVDSLMRQVDERHVVLWHGLEIIYDILRSFTNDDWLLLDTIKKQLH